MVSENIFYNSESQIDGIVDSYLHLYYKDCSGDCYKTAQNITFCVDQSPGGRTSTAFANEQTIDMIKILIGKY